MELNILLVDDSATVRGLVARALRLAGLPLGNISQAGNGVEALEVLNTQEVDVVVTDIHMPEMDGLALIAHLRADPKLKHLPVIVVSTEGGAERIAEARELGIKAYLRKPFKPEQVKEAVNCAVGVVHE